LFKTIMTLEECIQQLHPAMAATKNWRSCKQQCRFDRSLFMAGFERSVAHSFDLVVTTETHSSDDGTKERTWSSKSSAADRSGSAIEARCRQSEP
jgi:hypothetical protein